MTREEAADVAAYAKELFPRTTPARFVSLATAMLDFSNPAFAKQCLLHHSQNEDDMSIPAIRGMMELEEGRRQTTAAQRAERAAAEQQAIRDREDAERRNLATGMQSVDELLNALSDEDLEALKADVVAAMPIPCLVKGDPKTSTGLRRLMHHRLTNVQAQPRAQMAVSATIAEEFEV